MTSVDADDLNSLVACPFCGESGIGSESSIDVGGTDDGAFLIFCGCCYAEGPRAATAHEAIAHWNRRAAITTEQPPMDEPRPSWQLTPAYNYDSIQYVRISETPEDRRPALLRWLVGQTIPFVPGLNPMDAIYLDDYQRFIAGKPALD